MNTTDRILGEAMTPRQKRIYKDPEKAVRWAIKHGQRFPEAEPYILKATDPGWSYGYAKEVLKGRWPEAEAAIAKDPLCLGLAYHYALDVIKGRWPEAEEAIAKDPRWAYRYAQYVVKGRWPEAEPAIATSPAYALNYAKYVIKGRFPEAEPAIATTPHAYEYAKDVIGGRFPEAEEAIAKNTSVANPHLAKSYLELFPQAKLEWVMNGWLDWLDL